MISGSRSKTARAEMLVLVSTARRLQSGSWPCCGLINKAVWVSRGLGRGPGTCWVQAFLVVLSFPGWHMGWHMRVPKVEAAIFVPSSDTVWPCGGVVGSRLWCVGCGSCEAQVTGAGMLGMQVCTCGMSLLVRGGFSESRRALSIYTFHLSLVAAFGLPQPMHLSSAASIYGDDGSSRTYESSSEQHLISFPRR